MPNLTEGFQMCPPRSRHPPGHVHERQTHHESALSCDVLHWPESESRQKHPKDRQHNRTICIEQLFHNIYPNAGITAAGKRCRTGCAATKTIALRGSVAATMVRVSRTRVRQSHDWKQAIGHFGSYPRRNILPNCHSTSAEVAFLKNGGFPFIRAELFHWF